MNAADLRTRVRRLNHLSMRFSREVLAIQEGENLLLIIERKVYLEAIHRAIGGFEGARVALALALQRRERESD